MKHNKHVTTLARQMQHKPVELVEAAPLRHPRKRGVSQKKQRRVSPPMPALDYGLIYRMFKTGQVR